MPAKRMAIAKLRVPERVEQQHIVQLAKSVGCVVMVLGVTRKGSTCPKCGTFVQGHMGTQQTPGLPDLEIFLPARGARLPTLLKWEVKAVDGSLTPQQRAYRDLCATTGVLWGCGPYRAFESFLADWGLVKAENIPHYRRAPEVQP